MKNVINKLNKILNRKQRRRLFFLLIMMIIGAFLEVAGVSMIIPLVSVIMDPEAMNSNRIFAAVCALFGVTEYRTFVLLCIGGLILVFLVKNLFLILQTHLRVNFVDDCKFSTQKKLMRIFLRKPYEYYLNVSSGEIMRMIRADAEMAYGVLYVVLDVLSQSVVGIALLVTVAVIDPFMTVAALITMGVIAFLIINVVKPRMTEAGKSLKENTARENQWVLQAVSGIKEIKIEKKETYFETQYNTYTEKVTMAKRKDIVYKAIPRMILEMGSICTMLFIVGTMVWTGYDIKALIPVLSAFALSAVKLIPTVTKIINAVGSIAYNMPGLDQLILNLEGIGEQEEITPLTEDKEHRFPFLEKIEVRNITYRYPDTDRDILKDATMDIPKGFSVGIVGVSGAGKTTAVDILLGLLTPQGGGVYCDGKDIMENYNGWLSHIGYIPQTIFMLDDTIKANVAFGVSESEFNAERLWQALSAAHLDEFVNSLPQKENTGIGERGIRISGGQRQRIGIARALYQNPDILVFDEATSSLDTETEAAIMEAVNSLHGEKTLVIIAHRLETIKACDIVYRVEDKDIITLKE